MAETTPTPRSAAPDANWPPDTDSRVGRIQDAEMDVVVVLGRARLTLEELLALEPGQLVETDHKAGQPVEVLVNGRHFCLGEVVVIRDQLAIRVTDLPTFA